MATNRLGPGAAAPRPGRDSRAWGDSRSSAAEMLSRQLVLPHMLPSDTRCSHPAMAQPCGARQSGRRVTELA